MLWEVRVLIPVLVSSLEDRVMRQPEKSCKDVDESAPVPQPQPQFDEQFQPGPDGWEWRVVDPRSPVGLKLMASSPFRDALHESLAKVEKPDPSPADH